MAVHKFQVSMPVDSLLPRDYYVNTFHMDHVGGALLPADFDDLADDVIDLWRTNYGSTSAEVRCRVYDLGPPPNFPLADRVKSAGNQWSSNGPREIALCLSFAGANKSDPRQRGRMYLAPNIKIGGPAFTYGNRPTVDQRTWALNFFSAAGTSLPDLGGIDWKFGIRSPTSGQFNQAQQAWVDDEWDTVRTRGFRATTRSSSVREG